MCRQPVPVCSRTCAFRSCKRGKNYEKSLPRVPATPYDDRVRYTPLHRLQPSPAETRRSGSGRQLADFLHKHTQAGHQWQGRTFANKSFVAKEDEHGASEQDR